MLVVCCLVVVGIRCVLFVNWSLLFVVRFFACCLAVLFIACALLFEVACCL